MVEDMEDRLPYDPLLIFSLEVLELDGLLEEFGCHFLDEGDIEGINIIYKGTELHEVIPDLGLQGIHFLIEDGGT